MALVCIYISETRICLKALNMGKIQVRKADFVLGKYRTGTLVTKGEEQQKNDCYREG